MPLEPGSILMDDPLGYFLTWTTYGTWLPGDARGWVKKSGEFRTPEPPREQAAASRMTERCLTLSDEQRRIVEDTIAAHCRIRHWTMHAVNARTRHVHVVVTAPGRTPDEVMEQFKAWCTRKLKERARSTGAALDAARENWWTQRGSKRWLNEMDDLAAAVQYVMEEQGDPTPREGEGPQA